ncbi:single-strand binding protein (plasmid) [Thioalkalivibrio sp. K90mix]|uniref:single-stranded DNA-binding protein n=1 Tax=Thioalkalivibrio sp. (strain K90mix) TaxID=396595 RepID=UPI000195A955|nr:single-stranded DNA-binding protein [Thioalkalivibrio sp. K90mix]ADC73094.1 single-strand binding protein [Thioalkalivibrio sp. K90mix]ADC73369.1 single-strand binding protein [Thioalkalivibrio sp. K90mix]
MMTTDSNFTLLGELGVHPEPLNIRSGTAVRLSIAQDKPGGDRGWIKVIAFGKAAEAALSYARKGALVSVKGHMEPKRIEVHGTTLTTVTLIGEHIRVVRAAVDPDDGVIQGLEDSGSEGNTEPTPETKPKPDPVAVAQQAPPVTGVGMSFNFGQGSDSGFASSSPRRERRSPPSPEPSTSVERKEPVYRTSEESRSPRFQPRVVTAEERMQELERSGETTHEPQERSKPSLGKPPRPAPAKQQEPPLGFRWE